ncbi:MAG: hypothetical protein O3C23_01180 [bacterium]|nr:hypothetical protein [bacterium]
MGAKANCFAFAGFARPKSFSKAGTFNKLLCFCWVCAPQVLEGRIMQTQGLLLKTAVGKSFSKAGTFNKLLCFQYNESVLN